MVEEGSDRGKLSSRDPAQVGRLQKDIDRALAVWTSPRVGRPTALSFPLPSPFSSLGQPGADVALLEFDHSRLRHLEFEGGLGQRHFVCLAVFADALSQTFKNRTTPCLTLGAQLEASGHRSQIPCQYL